MSLLINNRYYNTNNTLPTNANNNSQTLSGAKYLNNKQLNLDNNMIDYSINFNNINVPEILENNENLQKKKEKNDKLGKY